jgi:signal transduction histidine kinase
MHHAWLKLFGVTVVSWLPWALATPLVLRLGRRFPATGPRPYRTWLVHIVVCVAIGLAFAVWTTLLKRLFNPYAYAVLPPPSELVWPSLHAFFSGMLSSVVLYAGILIVGYVLDYRERFAFAQTETARLHEHLSRAQLTVLRQQIEPHFLFNTLNAVAGLIREGQSEPAVNMLVALSGFLRGTLEGSARPEVSLREEIDFVQWYLEIQKARFADRLRLSLEIPSDLFPASVPNLILQPLVENAIKHGISKRARGGAIHITASRDEGMLTLRVANDGPSLPPDWKMTSSGIGMANVRARLQSLYGDAFALDLRSLETGGAEVRVSVPFRVPVAMS